MGVPALFRWLSKKYPKIVEPVHEDIPKTVPNKDGKEEELPIDMSGPNPNGEEFDCLYLDMNGIVHPCTHPEGKPAPETEEEMMVEIFAYTERVVNMVRPRKLLMLAIDGVAPRAKMNQQRSRRFRAAKEAKEKEDDKQVALAEWKAMGLPVTEEAMHAKKSWDSNAITPGTPFMDLLASSLRYWVAHKMNYDPGWKDLQVVISDASVPGEGEHKIMEHIRRQRSHAEHDPNTKHVIYGLDADLIMLSLATHEPYFKVLREDVFAQDSKAKGCHGCGEMGHIAVNCKGEAKPKPVQVQEKPASPPERKPFIFLDVSTLREYLEIELNVTGLPFAFDFERAIDDWVFLIFFVGNDFLPHLPSLEIREGAIDTLLKLWKQNLATMGGYLTNHGKVELGRAQVILNGLAAEEDEIFRRRKASEDRHEANKKRREQEEESRKVKGKANKAGGDDSFTHGDLEYVQVTSKKVKTNEAEKPAFNGMSRQEAIDQANSGNKSYDPRRKTVILGGDNNDTVRNRNAARQANLDAAEALKAELADDAPVTEEEAKATATATDAEAPPIKKRKVDGEPGSEAAVEQTEQAEASTENGQGQPAVFQELSKGSAESPPSRNKRKAIDVENEASSENPMDADANTELNANGENGKKDGLEGEEEKVQAEEGDDQEEEEDDEDEAEDVPQEAIDPVASNKLKVNADGTVEYQDTVKLWEPGYRERYYREKFGIDLQDVEFRQNVVKSYMEGLCWVLAYYYQGVPSWHWYYPYHYSPFATDFEEIEKLDIKFELGQPFKPFEQLMGVLPADSRASIPPAFHPLMTEDDSQIIDFYPTDFQIDMNGKKMAWQGVALLPFIDEKRLLAALSDKYPLLTEDQVRRNGFGNSTLFVNEDSRLYDFLSALYAKGSSDGPVALNAALSGGITGTVRPDPTCVPGSTFDSPLISQDLHDIHNDKSISVLYDFPEQKTPHRSVLLKGVRPPKRVLTASEIDWVRRGGPNSQRGRGRGRGGYHQGGGREGHSSDMGRMANNPDGSHGRFHNQASHDGSSYGSYGGNYGSYNNHGSYGGNYGGAGAQAGFDSYASYGGYASNNAGGYGGGYGGGANNHGDYGSRGSGYGGVPSGPRHDDRYAAYTNPDPYTAGKPSRGGGRGGARGGGASAYSGGGYGGGPSASLGYSRSNGNGYGASPAAASRGGYGGGRGGSFGGGASGGYGDYGGYGSGSSSGYGGGYGGYGGDGGAAASPSGPAAAAYGNYDSYGYGGAPQQGARGGGSSSYRGGGRGGRGGSFQQKSYGGGGGVYGGFY